MNVTRRQAADAHPRTGDHHRRRIILGVITLTAALFLVPVAHASALGNVTVLLTGDASGNVTGGNEEEPGGIECSDEGGAPGPSCEHEFGLFTTGTFTPTPGPGAIFTGWTTGPEACEGSTEPCSISFSFGNANTTLTANFVPARPSAIVSIDPVEPAAAPPCTTGITAEGACFSGTVDPNGGGVTSCRFEVVVRSDPEGFASQTKESYPCHTPDGSDAGSISEGLESEHPVTATASGLEPGTAYRVRVYAAKEAAVPATAEAPPFTTEVAAASVLTEKAWSISDTGATLTGTVNPRNSPLSECRFEFGASEGYGESVPCRGAPSAGDVPVSVTAELEGLQPGTTYHFRLAAESGTAGLQAGGDATFETRPPIVFPERHYELVSPADTNGIPPVPEIGSTDGERLAYTTFLPSPPEAQSGKSSLYVATRHADGSWSQRSLGLAPQEGEPDSGPGNELFTQDLRYVTFNTELAAEPDDQNGSQDVDLEDVEGGPVTWLSRSPSIDGPQTEPGGADPLYISADGHRVIFRTESRELLPDARPGALYQWDRGTLSLISRVPASGSSCDDTLGPTCVSASGFVRLGGEGSNGTVPGNEGTKEGAVSTDGSRVTFETGAAPFQRIFVRIDGRRTVEASASGPGAPALGGAPGEVNYGGADAEMNNVFFTSSSPLTADSGAEEAGGGLSDLYDYDVGTESLRDLTPVPGGGGVLRVYDVSEDGRRVYLTSSRRLDKEGRLSEEGAGLQGAAGGPNLYLAELDGGRVSLTFIATIDQAEFEATSREGGERWGGLGPNAPSALREVDANPDGSLLAFRDRLEAVPGRPTGGRPQVLIYDAKRNELSCASCPAGGAEATASANLVPSHGPRGEQVGLEAFPFAGAAINEDGPHPRDISSDGAVFFQTANSLVAADSNGRIDVYEWRAGKVDLISAGVGARASAFAGASEDGSIVFFGSSDGLTPGAQAGIEHIYAARVGPGQSPDTPAPPCGSADCRGAVVNAPILPAAGTAGFVGPGNAKLARGCRAGRVPSHRRCVAPKKHHRRKHHRRAHRDRRHAR